MKTSDLSRRFQHLVSVPTAPFREHWVNEALDELLARIPGVRVAIDKFGNRHARLTRGKTRGLPLVFVAHTDHPGFVFPLSGPEYYRTNAGTFISEALFEGRVRDEYFVHGAVRLYRDRDDRGIPGRILSATPVSLETDNRIVKIETVDNPSGATLAMWDVPVYFESQTAYHGRVCDDLMGCATMVEALSRLAEMDAPVDVTMLFTRAEEAGFCGTLCLLNDEQSRRMLDLHSLFVSVEISGETPENRLDCGAIIRVGDQSTIFDGEMANLLWSAAQGANVSARRALMDRGTCEATPISLAGLRVGGICSPVRNYHNMNTETGRVDAEMVSISDCEALVELVVEVTKFVGAGSQPNVRITSEFDLFLSKGFQQLPEPAQGTEEQSNKSPNGHFVFQSVSH
ncbi:MAG: hypothetical protein SFY68_14275 [Candidatus Sumerlaeia bacterium]|nr:hypothetical protein [Candidatus Sumerlaeia bacterium]